MALLETLRADMSMRRSLLVQGVTQVAERDRNMKIDIKFVAAQLRDDEEKERRILAQLGLCETPPMVRHIRTYSTRGY
ncbi:MAG TPA: hypothetical protein VFS91_00875 [Nitrobacter sp.]|nr:hypothetical protein [Nitrobacter sp.]